MGKAYPVIPALSSTNLPGALLAPDDQFRVPTLAQEMGGIGLNNPSQGLRVQVWTLETDGTNVTVSAPNTPATVLFTGTNITQVDLAFDQNMRPFVAFVENGLARYWWYDTQTAQATFTDLAGAVTPRCCMDDKRPTQTNSSDIILAYLRDRNLYMRVQRDRYGTEYLLASNAGAALSVIGMGDNLRLHFGVSEP